MKNQMYFRQVGLADINETTEYVAVYNGQRYFGKFARTTYDNGLNFVMLGSIFPLGIPFASLDSVWQEVV